MDLLFLISFYVCLIFILLIRSFFIGYVKRFVENLIYLFVSIICILLFELFSNSCDLTLLFIKLYVVTIMLSLLVVKTDESNNEDNKRNNLFLYSLMLFVSFSHFIEMAEMYIHGKLVFTKYVYILIVLIYNALSYRYVYLKYVVKLRSLKFYVIANKELIKIIILLLFVQILSVIILLTLGLAYSSRVLISAILLVMLVHVYIVVNELSIKVANSRMGFSFSLLEDDYSAPINLINGLILYFLENKPYLDHDLQLREVARKVYTNKTYISYVLNSNLSVNFNQFVNFLRIKEACERYINDNSLTANDLVEICGFNSFTSFNSSFKYYMGCCPTEWFKMVKKEGIRYDKIDTRKLLE